MRTATVDRRSDVHQEVRQERTAQPRLRAGPRLRAIKSRFPRGHLLVLSLILLAGLLRGTFWVVTTEIWNPMDEPHHYAYVQSLATGDGIPTLGKDKVSPEVLRLLKDTPTLFYRAQAPYDNSVANPSWGSMREQYEAIQPPLYYALMVPAYWASRPLGLVPSVYAIRLATVLLSLTAVPLAWLLARELFPRRRAAWLAAPALLVALQGFNMTLASVNNDALVVPAAAAVLLAVARAWRGLTYKRAVIAGLALGAAVLTKSTTVGLVLLIALPLLAMVLTRRQPPAKVLLWSLALGATAAAVVLPWLAWNMLTYGALTASKALSEVRTFNWQGSQFSLDVMRAHLLRARMGFWDGQLRGMGLNPYPRLLEMATVVALGAGVIVSVVRRRRGEAAWLLWAGLALPFAFVGMEIIGFLLLGGGGEPYGRHLYFALVPACVAMAAGLVVALGSRWGTAAVLAVVALAFGREQVLVRHYVADVYESDVLAGGLAPVVDQSLNEFNVPTRGIGADPPCPVRVVGLSLLENAPASVAVREGSVSQRADLAGTTDASFDEIFGAGQGKITLYRVDRPLLSRFEVQLPKPAVLGGSSANDQPRLWFTDRSGQPVARLYCASPDASVERFRQLYGPHHPGSVTRARVLAWPSAWTWFGRLAFVAALVFGPLRYVLSQSRSRPRRPARPGGGARRRDEAVANPRERVGDSS